MHTVMLLGMTNKIPSSAQVPKDEDLLLCRAEDNADVRAKFKPSYAVYVGLGCEET